MEENTQRASPGSAVSFPPLEAVTKPSLTTAEYAYYTNIRAQTARVQASTGCGPLRPRRIGGRLHWSTSETKKLLGVM